MAAWIRLSPRKELDLHTVTLPSQRDDEPTSNKRAL